MSQTTLAFERRPKVYNEAGRSEGASSKRLTALAPRFILSILSLFALLSDRIAVNAESMGPIFNNRRILMQATHLESTNKDKSIDFEVKTTGQASEGEVLDLTKQSYGDENPLGKVMPVEQHEQKLKVFKAKGQGTISWYAVSYNGKGFIVPEADGTINPARIVGSDGSILDIHSGKTKATGSVLEKIWATLVFPDAKYISIPDSLWEKAIQLPTKDEAISPAITFLSGNIINANEVAFGSSIRNQIIQIKDQATFTSLIARAEAEGTEIEGSIFTSEKGFTIVDFKSYVSGSKTDRYRVCVFCLKELFDGEPAHLKDDRQRTHVPLTFQDLDSLTESKTISKLQEYFWANQHDLPRVVFIEDRYPKEVFFLIEVQDGTYISFEPEELKKIVELDKEGELEKPWVEQVNATLLNTDATFAPLILFNDQVYELNTDIVKDFSFHDAKSYEPAVAEFKSNEIQIGETDYSRLKIKNHNLKTWFTEGMTMPGLFLPSHVVTKRGWPFVLHLEDNVVRQYFLNVDIIKTILTTGKDKLHGDLKETAVFVEAHKSDIKFDIINSNEKFEYMSWNHIVYQGQTIFLTAKCLEAFYSLEEPEMFVFTDPSKHVNLNNNQKFVRVEGKPYIFNFNVLTTMVENDKITDPKKSTTIRRCLELSTLSQDPEVLRNVTVSQTKYFTGKCKGDFINETTCRGVFEGNYFYCSTPYSGEKCQFIENFFTCSGEMSTAGCEGSVNGKFFVNGTLFNLETDQSFSIIQHETKGKTVLTFSNETAQIKIICEKNYNVLSQDCEKAELDKSFSEGEYITKMKLTCAGTLRLTKLDCADALETVTTCIDFASNQDPTKCTNTYYSRVCNKGGDFENCYIYSPSDQRIDCFGGVWDGSKCTFREKFVIVDDTRYFGAQQCIGDYKEGVFCDGTFEGYLIKCPGALDTSNLCGEQYSVDTISCKGKLTKNGCEGTWLASSTVNSTLNFSIETHHSHPPEEINVYPESQVTLTLQSNSQPYQEGVFNWLDLAVRCEGGYSEKTKICKTGVLRGASKGQSLNTFIQIECRGDLHLDTLECSNSPVTIHNCTSDSFVNPLPACDHLFTVRRCQKGGSPFTCLSESVESNQITCNLAQWDGKKCLQKNLIIVLTDYSYVTGTCDGIYTEFTSCKGELTGQIVICPKTYFHPDITCRAPEVHNFVCRGFADKRGCKGVYKGLTAMRGDYIDVLVDKNGFSTYFKQIVNDTTTLTFNRNINKKTGFVTRTDIQLNGKCYDSFRARSKACKNADVNITQINAPNITQISTRCTGTLYLNNLTCENGQFYLAKCTSDKRTRWTDHSTCVGEYLFLNCTNGGAKNNCTNPTSKDLQYYCDGWFSKGVCNPFAPPQLPIIEINSTYYIKGKCSSKIHSNECHGRFVGKEVVTCKGDPLHNQTDYDACEPIPGEGFGNCTGVVNKTGCTGKYSQYIQHGDQTWTLRAMKPVRYDTVVIKGVSRSVRRDPQTPDITDQLFCYKELNPRAMQCQVGIHKRVDKMSDTPKPGVKHFTSHVCDSSVLDIYDRFTCKEGNYRFYDCVGKSQFYVDEDKFERRYSCLGSLNYGSCTAGGNQDGCFGPDQPGFGKKCESSYFDGQTCISDIPSNNTKLNVEDLGRQIVTDIDGQEAIIRAFVIQDFTMMNAYTTFTNISDSVLFNITLSQATRNEDGSLHNIDLPDEPVPTKIDEGILTEMKFRNFQLDELPYLDLCTDPEAKIIKVTIKSMKIDSLFLENTLYNNIVAEKIVIGNETLRDYGIDKLEMTYAFGDMTLRDVTFYLPSIPADNIREWQSTRGQNIQINLGVPRVEGIEVPNYKLKFTGENALFIEFPELTIEHRSLDLLRIEDFILGSDNFTTNPSAAALIKKNYDEWIRISKEKREDN